MSTMVGFFLIAIIVAVALGTVLSRIVEVVKENHDPHMLCLTIVDRSGRTIGTRNVSPQEAQQILHAPVPSRSSFDGP